MTRHIYSKAMTLPRVPEDVLDAAIRGEVVIHWHEQRLPLRLRPDEEREYRRAQERGYLNCRGKQDALRRAWFYWCENHDHPYVRVQFGPRYAAVTLDLIAQSWRLTDPLVAGVRRAMEQLLVAGLCKRGAQAYSGHAYSALVGVRNDHAHLVAEALLRAARESKDAGRLGGAR